MECLPAEGGTVASLIGYSEAKRFSKKPEEFGKGSIEGIAGAEAANNAATGGAMVPTLSFRYSWECNYSSNT